MTPVTATALRIFREATMADALRLCEMFERFRTESPYAKYEISNSEVTQRLIERLIAGPDSVVLVTELTDRIDGMFGAIVSDHPMTSERCATELFWWIEPECRGFGAQLLRRAEHWAVKHGAQRMIMVSPAQSQDVDRIYEVMGYEPVETSWQKPLDWFSRHQPKARTFRRYPHGLVVHDDVLQDPQAYRTMALAQRFQAVRDGPVTFQRIAPCADPTLPMWIARTYPQLTPTLSFFRQAEQDQAEPHYIHTDASMGDWTAILYLNPEPPVEDGTVFWRSKDTGWVAGMAVDNCESQHWFDNTKWTQWAYVHGLFGRLVLFPSPLYHSRAIRENYGHGDDARLIQVCFGIGVLR